VGQPSPGRQARNGARGARPFRTAPAFGDHQADPPYLLRLLRARRERPGGGRAAEKSDELAPLHSITSSAATSSLSGTVRPSALAVLRLMTSPNLTGT